MSQSNVLEYINNLQKGKTVISNDISKDLNISKESVRVSLKQLRRWNDVGFEKVKKEDGSIGYIYWNKKYEDKSIIRKILDEFSEIQEEIVEKLIPVRKGKLTNKHWLYVQNNMDKTILELSKTLKVSDGVIEYMLKNIKERLRNKKRIIIIDGDKEI